MTKANFWKPKFRTLAAMARLCWAALLVEWIPFKLWHGSLGSKPGRPGGLELRGKARQFAADVEWAARRLPFPAKCLPRAMALSWMLRKRAVGHTVVIAVRPNQFRQSPNALHAWVEVEGDIIAGDLPGPWIEALRIGV